ncbi:MAG: TonB-dependent receptor [bacterium]
MRLTLLPALHLKAAYEYTARLPEAEEIFGDGALLAANTGLRSERSHNANLGVELVDLDSAIGRLDASAQLFYRRTRDLIFLSQVLDSARYENISDVDTQGVDLGVRWTGFSVLTLGASGTWLAAINRSDSGWFGRFEGDRIPNLPYLVGNLEAAVALPLPAARLERLRLYWYGRAVHGFYLFWESEGRKDGKLAVPDRFTQDVGVSLRSRGGRLTVTGEARNVTDEAVFDNVGVQLPGRSLPVKLEVAL